jgi:hypothetical protein
MEGGIAEKTAFYRRAFGEYFWAYWLMMLMSSIFPMLLFNNRLGNNLFFLFFIILGMNIGRIFELKIVCFGI